MSKKEGKGLKSFNKGFQVPDTYIIIFLVVVVAALLTFLVPKGFYETQDISYMINKTLEWFECCYKAASYIGLVNVTVHGVQTKQWIVVG